MEEIEALAENLRLMVGLDAQSLLGMHASEPVLQRRQDVLGHVSHSSLGAAGG
jgi:hypothetical protein